MIRCPKCRERIDDGAVRCRYCSHDLTPEELASPEKSASIVVKIAIGIGLAIVALFAIGMLGSQNADRAVKRDVLAQLGNPVGAEIVDIKQTKSADGAYSTCGAVEAHSIQNDPILFVAPEGKPAILLRDPVNEIDRGIWVDRCYTP